MQVIREPSAKPPRWATLMTRPMFSSTRRPYVPPPEPEPEPLSPTEPEIVVEPEPEPIPEPEEVYVPPPPPPPPELGLSMRGVIIIPGRRMALFLDTIANREISLSIGDTLREWSLVEIGPRRSVFVHGEMRRELALPTPKD